MHALAVRLWLAAFNDSGPTLVPGLCRRTINREPLFRTMPFLSRIMVDPTPRGYLFIPV